MLSYNINRFIFILSTSLFLVTCKNAQIIDAYKVKHNASLPNLSNYIEYTIIIKVDVDFEINSIELDNIKFSEKIREYSFVNLKNHSGYKVIKHPNAFKKGTYKFNFSIEENDYFNLDDIVNFNYSVNKKSDKLQIKVSKTKVFSDR
ncbi:hypothetical protein [Flavobacterium sp.]|uniref:hypothetical protein n=1 Tax=Flavobacterium sp. TaxID=239 RepID=UPI003527C7EE